MKIIRTYLMALLPVSAVYASFEVKPVATLNVYDKPFLKAKVIDTKTSKDTFKLEYCNKFGWCKLKDKNGFIKKYEVNILKSKKTKKKISQKEVINQKQTIKKTKTTQKLKAYEEAISAFKDKDYKKSYEILNSLVNEYPADEKINFFYGRSAFELKKYEFAFAAYDRILITNPNNHRARLEFARTMFMMKAYKEAKKEAQKVLSSPIPKVVRANVERFIEMVEANQKSYFLNKVAIFGFGYDSNIDNNTYEGITYLGDIPLNNDTDKKSDYFFKTILVGNLIVPNKKNENIAWESLGIAYMQEQKKHHKNDIFLTSLSSGIAYINKKYKNLTSATYDHIWVGGDQTLYIYGLANNLRYMFTKDKILTFDAKVKKKKMIKIEDQQKDANVIELAINYTMPINTKDKLNLFSTYISERKTNGIRTDISKDISRYKVSYDKTIYNLDFNLGYEIEKSKYKINTSGLPLRDDDKRNISLRVMKKLSKKKMITLELSDIDTKSNVNTYSYDKRTANLNYTLVF